MRKWRIAKYLNNGELLVDGTRKFWTKRGAYKAAMERNDLVTSLPWLQALAAKMHNSQFFPVHVKRLPEKIEI